MSRRSGMLEWTVETRDGEKTFRVGQRIKMKDRCREDSRLVNATGTIVDIHHSYPEIGVEFDEKPAGATLHDCNGKANDGYGYYVSRDEVIIMLEPEEVTEVANVDEWIPERFPMAGQRVILNPESERFERFINDIGVDAGYILWHNASEDELKIVLRKGSQHMPNWSVTVLFDNGRKKSIRVRHLLSVSSSKTVTHIRFIGGGEFQVMEGLNDRELDGHVINSALRIREKSVFDDAKRNKIIADTYEILGRQS